jgi:hypothetical protein
MIPIAVCIVAVCALAPSVASAASCDEWTHAGGGDWATASNWSAGVPTAATNVCLDNSDVTGSYAVDIDTYNPALVANSITVGGSAGSLVTLDILGTGGGVQVGDLLTLSNQDDGGGILPTGALRLGMTEGGGIGQPGAISATSGTLVNQGTVTADPTSETGQNDVVNGNFDNQGVLNVNQSFLHNAGNFTTSGTINVASGFTAEIDNSGDDASFTQTGGAIASAGTFRVNDGTFVGTGGTSTGSPLILASDNAGITVSPGGTGTDSLHIQTGGAMLGSSIGAGYTVWASGMPGYSHGNLTTASGSLVNYGTLELGSIDGTHGTLTVPSGSFTNDATLVFENTANGPDGLDGTLVNNGTVSVPNNAVQGTGAIVNNGNFALSAGATFAATSYSQGAGGTLALAITGGGSPAVPELRLSGAAALGGTLTVSTTGGTATGTFPVIANGSRSGAFAATQFSAENYSVGYTSAGVSLTGPAAPPAAATPVVHVEKISGGKRKLTVKLSCPAGGASCRASIVASVTEHLKGNKLVAVTARAKRVHTKTVVVGRATVSLAAGATKTITVTLNGKGNALLAKYGRLKMSVTVSANGKKLKTATVTVQKAKKKKGR